MLIETKKRGAFQILLGLSVWMGQGPDTFDIIFLRVFVVLFHFGIRVTEARAAPFPSSSSSSFLTKLSEHLRSWPLGYYLHRFLPKIVQTVMKREGIDLCSFFFHVLGFWICLARVLAFSCIDLLCYYLFLVRCKKKREKEIYTFAGFWRRRRRGG